MKKEIIIVIVIIITTTTTTTIKRKWYERFPRVKSRKFLFEFNPPECKSRESSGRGSCPKIFNFIESRYTSSRILFRDLVLELRHSQLRDRPQVRIVWLGGVSFAGRCMKHCNRLVSAPRGDQASVSAKCNSGVTNLSKKNKN